MIGISGPLACKLEAEARRIRRLREARCLLRRRERAREVFILRAGPVEIPEWVCSLRIISEVSKETGFPIQWMAEKNRSRNNRPLFMAQARVAYRLYTETRKSLHGVGKYMGDRDHTAALNLIRRYCDATGIPRPHKAVGRRPVLATQS
jgi:hypothetical protein